MGPAGFFSRRRRKRIAYRDTRPARVEAHRLSPRSLASGLVIEDDSENLIDPRRPPPSPLRSIVRNILDRAQALQPSASPHLAQGNRGPASGQHPPPIQLAGETLDLVRDRFLQ